MQTIQLPKQVLRISLNSKHNSQLIDTSTFDLQCNLLAEMGYALNFLPDCTTVQRKYSILTIVFDISIFSPPVLILFVRDTPNSSFGKIFGTQTNQTHQIFR